MIYNEHASTPNVLSALLCVPAVLWQIYHPGQCPLRSDLPSPWALQPVPTVPNLPECTLFPARIPDTEHTPGTRSKPRQSEILNCPWDSIHRATDWQKPRRGVSKANMVCALIASEREGFFFFFWSQPFLFSLWQILMNSMVKYGISQAAISSLRCTISSTGLSSSLRL